jgi:hypothetical protein
VPRQTRGVKEEFFAEETRCTLLTAAAAPRAARGAIQVVGLDGSSAGARPLPAEIHTGRTPQEHRQPCPEHGSAFRIG